MSPSGKCSWTTHQTSTVFLPCVLDILLLWLSHPPEEADCGYGQSTRFEGGKLGSNPNPTTCLHL